MVTAAASVVSRPNTTTALSLRSAAAVARRQSTAAVLVYVHDFLPLQLRVRDVFFFFPFFA